jgi:uncharacterized protein
MTTGTNDELNLTLEDHDKYIYDKTITCPVCGKTSKNKAVKKSVYKITHRDSDSMIHYSGVNPSFYEVIYCSECGYTALPQYFIKATEKTKRLVSTNITPKWTKPTYPEFFDVYYAIKQMKLALHNAFIKEALNSEIGLICLKLSWLYRLISDIDNEKRFQEQTINSFENAYMKEKSQYIGIDEFTMQYLIGELYRRLENNDKALLYFSNILISQRAPQKLKEKVRDQKDLIKLK